MNIIERVKAPLPTFHKNARNISAMLAVIVAITIAVKPSFIPEPWIEILKYLDALLAGVAGWAQTTVKDSTEIPK